MKQKALTIRDLCVSFQTSAGPLRAVRHVDLDLYRGETLAIVGESGSGKSVTVKTVMGILSNNQRIDSGSILYHSAEDETDTTDLSKLSRREMRRKINGTHIAMVFQDPMTSLDPTMTIGMQLMEGMIYHLKLTKAQAYQRAIALLKMVGITDAQKRMKNYPHQLSGGMRQRVVIAMATFLQPSMIFADEPTTALDVVVQKNILMMLMDLQSKMKNTLVIVSHDMGVHYQITNRMAIMYSGSLMEIGPTEEIFANPLHPYTQMLINALPKVGDKSKREGIAGGPPSLRTPPPGCRFAPRCKMACPECSKSVPEFVQVAPGRYAACHFLKKMEGGKDLNAK